MPPPAATSPPLPKAGAFAGTNAPQAHCGPGTQVSPGKQPASNPWVQREERSVPRYLCTDPAVRQAIRSPALNVIYTCF